MLRIQRSDDFAEIVTEISVSISLSMLRSDAEGPILRGRVFHDKPARQDIHDSGSRLATGPGECYRTERLDVLPLGRSGDSGPACLISTTWKHIHAHADAAV